MTKRQQSKQNKLAMGLATHRRVARTSLHDLLAAPVATAVTTLVIGVALIFPSLLYLVGLNISTNLSDVNAPAQLSVYLDSDLTEAQVSEVSERLQTFYTLESLTVIAPEQALEEFGSNAGLSDVLLSLPDNPLPYTLILTISPDSLNAIEMLTASLELESGVASVVFDLLWLQRIRGFSALLNRLGLVLLIVVLVGLVTIVGNTIKLAVSSREQEIRVIKLVGGTDAFNARPFLYRGTFLGLAGALVACLLLAGMLLAFSGPVAALSQLYGGGFQLSSFSITGYGGLLLLGTSIGWIAAFLSSWRNIATIEP